MLQSVRLLIVLRFIFSHFNDVIRSASWEEYIISQYSHIFACHVYMMNMNDVRNMRRYFRRFIAKSILFKFSHLKRRQHEKRDVLIYFKQTGFNIQNDPVFTQC